MHSVNWTSQDCWSRLGDQAHIQSKRRCLREIYETPVRKSIKNTEQQNSSNLIATKSLAGTTSLLTAWRIFTPCSQNGTAQIEKVPAEIAKLSKFFETCVLSSWHWHRCSARSLLCFTVLSIESMVSPVTPSLMPTWNSDCKKKFNLTLISYTQQCNRSLSKVRILDEVFVYMHNVECKPLWSVLLP
jgi:hypothetical protein